MDFDTMAPEMILEYARTAEGATLEAIIKALKPRLVKNNPDGWMCTGLLMGLCDKHGLNYESLTADLTFE